MRRDEVTALGAVAGAAVAGAVSRVEELHDAIAGRVFSAVGPIGTPVRSAHDTIAGGVYATVRGAGATLLRAGGAGAGLAGRPDAPSLAAGRRGGMLLGALNGAFGDGLHAHHGALSLPMTVRRAGEDVPLEPAALRHAFPTAGPRVAVFLHGLGKTERSWRRRPAAHGRGLDASYPTLLEEDLRLTSVVLRYNSGRHISENGDELAALLERLCAAWPVPVAEVVLIGHSMGGLVARSACHRGRLSGQRWVTRVSHLVCLGTPHLGAPLERATHRATLALGQLPETRALATLLNLRAVGVKDLRYGAFLEEHWAGHDPDAPGRDTVGSVDELPQATHYSVSANLGAQEDHLLGRLLGDVLVPRASAAGTGHPGRRPLRFDGSRHFAGLSHFALLNDPAVYAQLRAWLAPRPQRRLGPGAAPVLLTAGPR